MKVRIVRSEYLRVRDYAVKNYDSPIKKTLSEEFYKQNLANNFGLIPSGRHEQNPAEKRATRSDVWALMDEMGLTVADVAHKIGREPRRLRRELSRVRPGEEKISILILELGAIRKLIF